MAINVNYSAAVGQVWDFAEATARENADHALQPVHMLVGLLRAVNPKERKIARYRAAVANARLAELDIDLDELRAVLSQSGADRDKLLAAARRRLPRRASDEAIPELRRSEACLTAFREAERATADTRNETVRPVHLLAGLLSVDDDVVSGALGEIGIGGDALSRAARQAGAKQPAQQSSAPVITNKHDLKTAAGPVITNKRDLKTEPGDGSKARKLDAVAIAKALKDKVVGQDVICDEIARAIRRSVAQEKNECPIGIFLLAGTPGTGKTFTAKCLAQVLGRTLAHFDMAKYDQAHNASRLFGSPPGYQGAGQPGELTKRIEEDPAAVVLLDEFEKAHDSVHKQFLTAFNDGFFDDMGTGRQVQTNRAIFILTTNAASGELLKAADQHGGDRERFLARADHLLRDSGFAPEVLSRVHDIFCFRPFDAQSRQELILRTAKNIVEMYGMALGSMDLAAIRVIEQRFESLGNRASARSLRDLLYRMIADTLIDAKDQEIRQVALDVHDEQVVAVPAE
jgi:ATP-dependent Clp protease ATP-binding subunit ClpA